MNDLNEMNGIRGRSGVTGTNGVNGINGTGNTTSLEYCVIRVKVEVFDVKKNKEIIGFNAMGEASVFLFNYGATLEKAKEKSIDHIVNYLKSGKSKYKKD